MGTKQGNTKKRKKKGWSAPFWNYPVINSRVIRHQLSHHVLIDRFSYARILRSLFSLSLFLSVSLVQEWRINVRSRLNFLVFLLYRSCGFICIYGEKLMNIGLCLLCELFSVIRNIRRDERTDSFVFRCVIAELTQWDMCFMDDNTCVKWILPEF